MKRLGLILAALSLLGAGYYLRRLAPRGLRARAPQSLRAVPGSTSAPAPWSAAPSAPTPSGWRSLPAPAPAPRPTPPPDTTELRVKPWAKTIVQPFLSLFMEGRKPAATTIGHRIYYYDAPSDQTRKHEYVHVEQADRLGTVGFMAAYTAEWFKKGYHKNKFEVEACDRARRTP